jgi:hypothetical protein
MQQQELVIIGGHYHKGTEEMGRMGKDYADYFGFLFGGKDMV